MRTALLLMVLFMPAVSHASLEEAAQPDSGALFKAGIEQFMAGDCENAIDSLKKAYGGLPAVGDYILLYLSRCYFKTGDNAESLGALRELSGKFPDSPLIQEARAMEIHNTLATDREAALSLLETYTRDYPPDGKMRLLYASLLREYGLEEKADSVYRALYIHAGPHALDAFYEMKNKKLGPEELIARSENLIQNGSYGEAEYTLKSLLKREGFTPREDVLKHLGTALFRQRKYTEASVVFREVGDLYNAARSFFRAGLEDDFYKTLDEMLERKDRKGADLLVALSNEVRRNGGVSNALELLDEAMKKYPSITEEALWSKGWALYSTRDYEGALDIFGRLHGAYKSSKYLYWKARTLEKTGKGATDLFEQLEGTDYYTFLAKARNSPGDHPDVNNHTLEVRERPMERIDLLIEAGLTDEAASELSALSQRLNTYDALLDIAYKLKSIEQYRKAILLVDLLPEDMKPHEILYPLAYWSTVKDVSTRYGIDPFLLLSVMREESHFDPMAVSSAGAIGLMQLMPYTARRTARRLDLEIDGADSIHEIENNLTLGAYYLSGLLDRFKSVTPALAAYNAGERRVKRWLRKGQYESLDEFIEDIPFDETRNYVKRIVTTYYRYQVVRFPEHGTGPGIL